MRVCVPVNLILIWVPVVLGGHRHCLGPGDHNGDHNVDLGDLPLLTECLGGPLVQMAGSCPSEVAESVDMDHDGDRDLADFAALARRFGQAYFDYGPPRADKEAEFHAMLLTSQLRAPDREYDRISRDLALIRSGFPDVVEVHDEGSAPNRKMVVRLFSDEVNADFLAINEYFVFSSIQDYGIETYEVEYCDALLNFVLAQIYIQSGEVRYAFEPTPGCMPVCCRNRIVVREVGEDFQYEFYYFESSPPGSVSCGCQRIRILQVSDDGTIDRISCTDTCLGECP